MHHLPVILAMGGAQLLIRVNGLLSGSLTLGMLLLLLMSVWLVVVCCSSRALSHSSPSQDKHVLFLGQPRLLPTQVSHTRLGTGRYNYTVPHFMVGTPVGLHGRVGSVLSLDEPSATHTQTAGLMQDRISPNLKSWFTVHAHHHLDKGEDSIGLEGKLHRFLVSQGQDPTEWPFAYLITMPQFLGYQRNLVCFWYLYSASRELTAMVMEVNNYWGQRKIAFTRLTGECPLSPSELQTQRPSSAIATWRRDAPAPEGRSTSVSESCQPQSSSSSSSLFHHSSPRHASYRGNWDKDMFISPFEKVEGSIALRLSDPLAPTNTALHITITLLSPTGNPRLIGRVFTRNNDPIVDPRTASPWTLLRFLPYWTTVLVVTELLIIVAALRIRSNGTPMHPMPEVRANNIPRDETDIERALEPAFRAYLKHLITTSPIPNLTLHYIPSKSHHLRPETFTSLPSPPEPVPKKEKEKDPTPISMPNAKTLTIQVLTPQLYTSFPTHPHPQTAFDLESAPSRSPSDPFSSRLRISDPSSLLPEFLSSSQKAQGNPLPNHHHHHHNTPPNLPTHNHNHNHNQKPTSSPSSPLPLPNPLSRFLPALLHHLHHLHQTNRQPQTKTPQEQNLASGPDSNSNQPSFLDAFVTTYLPPPDQSAYLRARVAHLLAGRVAFGRHSLLRVYVGVGYLVLLWGLFWGVGCVMDWIYLQLGSTLPYLH
ncbi:hypothetical protein BJX61DRAFT_79048 [Aspergillus egyptiacus]|nr:hypothetical protein BJX61DRAFT_79048 [Aspergillus egyptiacus]